MTTKEKENALRGEIEKVDFIVLLSVDSVNHKPHPYVIGAKHIEASSGMSLNIEECERKGVRCAHPHCNLSYEEHTFDMVAFLQLKRNCSQDEAQKVFSKLAEIMKQVGVDGIVLVDTKEKFRIV